MSDGYDDAVVRANIKNILCFCNRHGVDFDAALKSVRDEPQLIRMDRKYKTKDGQRVTILTVTAPETTYPVIGYCENRGCPVTWTATGEHAKGASGFRDLVLAEE